MITKIENFKLYESNNNWKESIIATYKNETLPDNNPNIAKWEKKGRLFYKQANAFGTGLTDLFDSTSPSLQHFTKIRNRVIKSDKQNFKTDYQEDLDSISTNKIEQQYIITGYLKESVSQLIKEYINWYSDPDNY